MIFKSVATLALGVSLVIIVANNVYELIQRFIPPVTMTLGLAENPVVERGGVIKLIYEYDHKRFCETTLIRFIVRVDTKEPEIVWRDRVPGGATPLGHQRVLNSMKLPPEIEPGKYEFRLFTSSNCGSAFFQSKADDIKFEVTK